MTTNLSAEKLHEKSKLHHEYFMQRPYKKLNGIRQIIAALRFRAPEKLKINGSVIVALGDTLVSPKCSEKIAKKYGFRMIKHPTGNHDLSADDPVWLADTLSKLAT